MTNRHHITDEQLGKEIGYLISNRVEYVTSPAATYLAIQDRLGEQHKNWLPARLIGRLVPGAWQLPVVAGRIAKITAGMVIALLIATILIWQGRDSDQGVQPAADLTPTPTVAGDSDVMNPDNRFDLSGMNASATEAEIIRLLNDGHVMYTRQKVMRKAFFEPGGVFMSAPSCIDLMRSIPKIVCEGYPETVIEEWWESVDSSGTVKAYFGRLTTLDDVLLATGIKGEWTDAGSGEKWSAGRREGRKLVRDVGTTFAIIEEKETENLVGTESEFAGRPSLIFLVADEYAGRPDVSFDDGESEYQVANPFFQRVAYWFDDEDGTRTMRSEITVLDFALLSPGSLPKFAVLPEPKRPNVPNLSEQLDLEGMDAATIQAEFTRLLAEGHVLYLRMERFGLGGAYNGLCGPAFGASMPQPVCDDYPGRIVRETWESTDLSGVVQISYGRESKLDGTVLAIKIQGTWTDVASGGTWPDNRREDFNLIESIEVGFTIIEREYERGLDGVESEYLGNPSIIFADTFEYQIVNPMLWRQVRMQELGDGMQTILSEARFTDVAILPPGSFPDFAVPAVVTPSVPATASPTPGLTASFTVHDLDLEPKTGTVFETLLSKLPDNQATRGYTRLGDPAGVIDALGGEPLAPGSSIEDATQFIQTLMEIDLYNGMFILLYEWPSEQRDYVGSIDTYPDLAFDWASVDQFAQSGGSFPGISFTSGNGQPTLYDVALGKFDAGATAAALNACECDQPEIREYAGVEYFAWGDGDGIGDIQRRLERPLYDFIGRGPHLLVGDGEAYYSVRDGVIDEHIDVIQGTSPSLAEVEDYVSAVQWIASMGIIYEISLRNLGFTVDEIMKTNRGGLTVEEIVQNTSLLAPFTVVATGIGNDRERMFVGLVIVHDDSAMVETNVERLLTRIRNVTGAGIGSNLTGEWASLVDRIDVKVSGRFLIARIYLNNPGYAVLLNTPNTLLVHE